MNTIETAQYFLDEFVKKQQTAISVSVPNEMLTVIIHTDKGNVTVRGKFAADLMHTVREDKQS